MLLDQPLDLGSAPDALRTALYTFARIGLDAGTDTSLDEDGHFADPSVGYHPEVEKLQEAAGAWRHVRETLDRWRAQCPPENISVFDSAADALLPRDVDGHWDAFHIIQSTGEEYRAMSHLYLISVQGIASEYAEMMLDGVVFTVNGRIASVVEQSEDPWEF